MIIEPPPGATELNRTINGKRFVMPDGSHKAIAKVGVVHVPDDPQAWVRGDPVQWLEPDLIPRLVRGEYEPGNTWYQARFNHRTLTMDYESKMGGRVISSLKALHRPDIPLRDLTVTPRINGPELWFDDIAPGLDLYIRFGIVGVRIYFRVKGTGAPHEFEWDREYDDLSNITVRDTTITRDNDNQILAGRTAFPGNIRRQVQMLDTKLPERPQGIGQAYTLLKNISTLTWKREIVNGVPTRTAVPELTYPILLNINETELVPTNNDDGSEDVDGAILDALDWDEEYATSNMHLLQNISGADFRPGFRFTNVDVDQGSTITSADLSFTTGSSWGGGTATAVIHGADQDDATAWPADGTGGDTPSQMTATTASVSQAVNNNSTTFTPSVTGIVQEIVDRGSWVADNAMKFGVVSFTGGAAGNKWFYIEDEGGVSNANRAQLEITFTPPATGRIMSSMVNEGGLAGMGGLAGPGGGLAG